MSLHIYIDTISHRQHRYPTVGDYWWPPVRRTGACERLEVRVSEMGNEDYEFLVTIHELIEAHLTRKHGISEESITAFDIAYEANRYKGDDSEPGDSPDAPYHNEHKAATSVEKYLARLLGVNWFEYEEAVSNLFEPPFSSSTTPTASETSKNVTEGAE